MKRVIYWLPLGLVPENKEKIIKRFGLKGGMNINGETSADNVKPDDIPLLEETAKRGFFVVRNKPE